MIRSFLLLAAGAALVAGPAAAQQPQALTPLAVGSTAPAFTLPSGTRDGAGTPVSLADFAGHTVVIAFFYRARSGG